MLSNSTVFVADRLGFVSLFKYSIFHLAHLLCSQVQHTSPQGILNIGLEVRQMNEKLADPDCFFYPSNYIYVCNKIFGVCITYACCSLNNRNSVEWAILKF